MQRVVHEMDDAAIYRLLTGCVYPRPIAWISTLDGDGVANLAPFSFFNVAACDPPTLAISIRRPEVAEKKCKDTLDNLRESGELVVHAVEERLLEQMNLSAAGFPRGDSEFAHSGLAAMPSVVVKPPRVAEAAIAMECRLREIIPIGSDHLVLAEVLLFHIHDDYYDKGGVDFRKLQAVGRLPGPNYCRTRDHFKLKIPEVTERRES